MLRDTALQVIGLADVPRFIFLIFEYVNGMHNVYGHEKLASLASWLTQNYTPIMSFCCFRGCAARHAMSEQSERIFA